MVGGGLVDGVCIAWSALGSVALKVGIMAYRRSMCFTRGVTIAGGVENSWSSCIVKE